MSNKSIQDLEIKRLFFGWKLIIMQKHHMTKTRSDLMKEVSTQN